MNARKLALGIVSVAVLAAATMGRDLLPARGVAADEMVEAGQRFIAALSAEERSQAVMSMDDPDRTRWHYVPTEMHSRKGLTVQDMTPESRLVAHGLLHSGLGQAGYLKATTIMSLEAILHRLETGGRLARNPELYFFSVFGEPAPTGKWGWRVEGHHLSLNFVVENGRLISATPAFFGANPAHVQDGSSREGLRTLPKEEDLARALFQSLGEQQRATALIAAEAPRDIRFPNEPVPDLEPEGLPVAEMNEHQKQVLHDLIAEYATRMPAEVAHQWMMEIREAGVGSIHFAWAGGDERGEPHYYRVQGPTFLIEYANTQNGGDGKPANHIHSVWRSRLNDFAVGG
jgi:hypothetical protein